MNLKDIEVCELSKEIPKYPMLVTMTKWVNTTFPGMVHKCPYAVSTKAFPQ
jgi:hypothetical protein